MDYCYMCVAGRGWAGPVMVRVLVIAGGSRCIVMEIWADLPQSMGTSVDIRMSLQCGPPLCYNVSTLSCSDSPHKQCLYDLVYCTKGLGCLICCSMYLTQLFWSL